MTYTEYLKANGATEEDLKLYDTPLMRRLFDKQQSEFATVSADRDRARADKEATDKWFYEKSVPEHTAMQNEITQAKAETAKFQAALRSAKDQGLIELPDDFFGAAVNPAGPSGTVVPPTSVNPNTVDPRYLTVEQATQLADREGDAIAIAQDIAFEHGTLFPGQLLNMRELRKRAVANRKSVEQQWMDEFKVPDARAAAAQKRQSEHDQKMRDEGAKAERERLAREFNPDSATPQHSNSPFTIRKSAGEMREKQPWERNEGALSDDRVIRVTRNLMNRLVQ